MKLPKNFGTMNYTKESQIKLTLATLRKIIRKEYGVKCKERSPLCCVCIAWRAIEDLNLLLK